MPRFLILVLSLTLATAASAGTFRTYEALEYASPDGTPRLMDLRVPEGKRPQSGVRHLHPVKFDKLENSS